LIEIVIFILVAVVEQACHELLKGRATQMLAEIKTKLREADLTQDLPDILK